MNYPMIDQKKCLVCGIWTTEYRQPGHPGEPVCGACRLWAKGEGRKAAEGALARGWELKTSRLYHNWPDVDRIVDAMLAELAGRD